MSEDEEVKTLEIKCDAPAPVARSIEKPLEQAIVLNDQDLELHATNDSGPFTPGLRVHCALQGFVQRKTEHCKECHFFQGAAMRKIHGFRGSEDDPRNAAATFTIICGHPTGRSLKYFPED